MGEPLTALGWERNPFSLLNDYYQDVKKNNAAYYDAALADSGEISRGTRQLLTMVTASLPQAALAIATLGGSIGGELSLAMPSVANAIMALMRNPMFWASFASTAGNSYYDSIKNGATDREATFCAVAGGLASAAVEVSGGLELLPSQLRQGESAVRSWIHSMLDEGKEEVVQGVIERAAQNVTSSTSAPIFSLSNERSPLNPLAAARDYISGVTVSSVLGGGQVAANSFLSGGSNTAANAQNSDKPLPAPGSPSYNETGPNPDGSVPQSFVDELNSLAAAEDAAAAQQEAELGDGNGGRWEPVNESMSAFSRAYQTQITGHTGEAYVLNNVKFDGFSDGALIEVKGRYSQFINPGTNDFFLWFTGDGLRGQAKRQVEAAHGLPIRWYFAEVSFLEHVRELFESENITEIELIFEPMKGE